MEQIKIEELDAYFTDKLDFYQQKNNRIILKPFVLFAYLISVRDNHPDEEKQLQSCGKEEAENMQALIEKAVRGDAEAFLELIDRNSMAMYKVAYAILNNDNDVADAIQETILSCFEKIHTLKKPEYFKTWLIRILVNNCIVILRHYHRENLSDEIPETTREDPSLAEFEFKQMLNLIDKKYRLILIFYYLEGFKISEIAEFLGMNDWN